MGIIIGADFVSTNTNIEQFASADAKGLLGSELLDYINKADYRIFNLESPICLKKRPIKKCGPNLICNPKTLELYKKINCNLVTIANNHIMDYGEDGLFSTTNLLDKAGINHIGAGKNINEASKTHVFEIEGSKIGVYACVEHEFGIASDRIPGSNPFDYLASFDHVKQLSEKCNYVIVLYHGGKEQYRYPSPRIQRTCRYFVDSGANLVVCQHSHCVGCEENYKLGRIVYGQGNFLFDYIDNDYWRTGLLINVSRDFSITYKPIVKKKNGVRVANSVEAHNIMEDFYRRSEQIKDGSFLYQNFAKYSEEQLIQYLSVVEGHESILFKCINKVLHNRLRTLRVKSRYKEKDLINLLNYIECEAHQEILIEGIKKKIGLSDY